MAHKQKKDPFVPVFFLIGALLLGGAVFTLVSNLFNVIDRNSVKGAEDTSRQVAIENASLKPIGSVTTTAEMPKGAAPVASSGGSDGKAVYTSTCIACHGTGAAGAPMISKKDQWAPRVKNGLDVLMHSALNGKGAMPVKGGNPSLSDDDIRAAILYMTKEAGFDLGGETKAKKAEPAAPVTDEKAAATTAPATDEKAVSAIPAPSAPTSEKAVVEEVPVKAPAPVVPAPVTTAPVDTVKKTTLETPKVEPTAPTKPEPVAEPKKPEIPSIPVTPIIPSAPVAPVSKDAPVTEKVETGTE